MSARTPDELQSLFAAAFNCGDLDAMMTLYEPAAVLASQSGLTQIGADNIRDSLHTIVAMKGTMAIETTYALQADSIALLQGSWSLNSITPVGKAVTMKGQSIEVTRRQADGTWRFLIDHPFGAI